MRKYILSLDKRVTVTSALICLVFVFWTALSPERAGVVLDAALNFLSTNFAWAYLSVVFIFICFLIWAAFSHHGSIVLGQEGDKPAYKTSAWFFMLFAAGMGIGLVFWSVAEPMSMYLEPPINESRSIAAAKEALAYTYLHWGVHPWACYGVVGLALAYSHHRLGRPGLLSSCFAPLWGEKASWGTPGAIVDMLAVIATVFGVATSLGMGAMQINSGLNYVFGVPYNTGVTLIIVIVATVLFIVSAAVGIDRGMKRLSDLNMYLVVILTLFVFIAGATVFVLNYMLESTGLYLREFIFQSLWTDTFSEAEGWLGAWTVFYWAWWISWSPFVGGFIARISRGRTIREFVVGVLVFPTVMSFVFITVMGGNAIYFDMQGASGIAEAIGVNISFSLFALFENLPFTQLFSVVALILITVFFITSADAATGVCAQMTTGGRAETPGILKVFWGVILGAVSAFLLIAGGLQALQTASIVVAFPFIAVCIGLMVAFVRALTNPVEPPVWITTDEPVNDRVGPVPGLTEEPPPE